MLTVGSLFSGIGGFDLGLERAGFQIKWQCEIDSFCLKVLQKHWPDVPKYGDIRQLTGDELGTVDVVVGGFPCQPFSSAGQRRGTADDRYLWPEMLRIISEIKPRWIIGENVGGLTTMGIQFGDVKVENRTVARHPDYDFYEAIYTRKEKMLLNRICKELEEEGYEVQPFVIPACGITAPHQRDRVWLIAHNNAVRCDLRGFEGQGIQRRDETCNEVDTSNQKDVSDSQGTRSGGLPIQSGESCETCPNADRSCQADVPDSQGKQNWRLQQRGFQPDTGTGDRRDTKSCLGRLADGLSFGLAGHWDREPDIPRIATGISDRVNKLKALGNSVVPQIVEILGRAILASERGNSR